MSTKSFNLDRLRTQIRPFRLHWFSRLRSTNDHAAVLRKRGELFAPALVLTAHQTAGRGRNTNTWWSGAGTLTVTFVLPIDEQLSAHQLPLIAGLAVRNAAANVSGNDAIRLKWPNDLLYRERKLAGLLCERAHKADLVGLGLNINPDPRTPRNLRDRIISLAEIAGTDLLDKTEVLIAIVKQLHPMLMRRAQQPFAKILREYDQHHALIGKRVTIAGNGSDSTSGVCQGLDSMGRLLLRSGTGELQRIIAGQVRID